MSVSSAAVAADISIQSEQQPLTEIVGDVPTLLLVCAVNFQSDPWVDHHHRCDHTPVAVESLCLHACPRLPPAL